MPLSPRLFWAFTTTGLIERLTIDRALRRICGFPLNKHLPSEATFSRAFEAFAEGRLAERVHEALIKESLGDVLIGHISRDGTAIEARERPYVQVAVPVISVQSSLMEPQEAVQQEHERLVSEVKKRGRPGHGEVRGPKESPIQRQRKPSLAEMTAEIPTACDRGTKCNAQGSRL